jgi:hypothetical protein
LTLKSNPSEVGERPANRVGERGDAAPGAAADVILDDSDDQRRRKALRRAFVLHENSFTFTPYGNCFDQPEEWRNAAEKAELKSDAFPAVGWAASRTLRQFLQGHK